MNHLDTVASGFSLPIPGYHVEIQRIDLLDGSDRHNNPVQIRTYVVGRKSITVPGKIFFVQSPMNQRSLAIVIEAPDYAQTSITVDNHRVVVNTDGFAMDWVKCWIGEEEGYIRRYFTSVCPKPLFTLVNNWGDSNHGHNISESFVMREIDRAARLGLDVVQIDDGWELGDTLFAIIPNPDGTNSEYRRFDGNFWQVNPYKFPHGLEPILEHAKKKNITMGLWFAPDSRNHFANIERDLAVLQWAYDLGFRYFKLDMVNICDREDYDAFHTLLQKAKAMGEDVSLQLDATASIRLGYLNGYEYGKIFVENRYIKDGIYLPTYTLKNLWELSHYMPAQRFQFELPNIENDTEDYFDDDLLSPAFYTSDYLFASLFVTNPLFWMEIQNMKENTEAEIKPLLKIWKENRDFLSECEVIPLGERPNGKALTGFHAKGKNGGIVVLLSEITDRRSMEVSLSDDDLTGLEDVNIPGVINLKNAQVLSSTFGSSIETHGATIKWDFFRERAYLILKY